MIEKPPCKSFLCGTHLMQLLFQLQSNPHSLIQATLPQIPQARGFGSNLLGLGTRVFCESIIVGVPYFAKLWCPVRGAKAKHPQVQVEKISGGKNDICKTSLRKPSSLENQTKTVLDPLLRRRATLEDQPKTLSKKWFAKVPAKLHLLHLASAQKYVVISNLGFAKDAQKPQTVSTSRTSLYTSNNISCLRLKTS